MNVLLTSTYSTSISSNAIRHSSILRKLIRIINTNISSKSTPYTGSFRLDKNYNNNYDNSFIKFCALPGSLHEIWRALQVVCSKRTADTILLTYQKKM